MRVKNLIAGVVGLAAALFAVCAITVCAGADIILDNYHTYGDYQYLSYDDKTAEIVKYTGSDTALEIPSAMDGKKVTSIGYYAFGYCDSLKLVTIPDSVTNISYGAFISCSKLTSVNIPDGVTNIDADVFTDTPFLNNQTTVVKYAGKWAIDCKGDAAAAEIKKGTVGIADSAFDDCTSLKSITVPDGVKSIGSGAFSDCLSLASINIPDSVKYIGSGAFFGTPLLNNQTGAVKYAENWAVSCDKEATSATIKSGTAGIASEVFFNCSSLASVTIPSSVTMINDDAFSSSLKNVYYIGSKAKWDKIAVGSNFYLLSANINYISVSGAKLKARAADALRLAWDKNTSVDGYMIEQKSGSSWKQTADINKNSTTEYRVSELKAGTTYSFRIKAYKKVGGTTIYSDYSTVTAATSPSAVGGFKLKARAADALRLAWDKNTSADGYIIERKDGSDWVRAAKITKNSTTEFRISKLKAGTTYFFRIKAYKMDGKTALYSGYKTISATTSPSTVDGFKLKARSSSTLRLMWSKNTSADGYILEQKSDSAWKQIAKFNKNTTAECRITGLKAGTAYSFRIKAYKEIGTSILYSGYVTLSARTNPTGISGFKLKERSSSVLRIMWNKNDSADGYILEQQSGGVWKRLVKFTKNTTTECRITGLKAGTAYSLRIKSYKMSGKTALYSGYTTLSARTKPTAVSGLKLKAAAKDAVRLAWDKNDSADGYIIEMKSGDTWTRVSKISKNSTVEYRKDSLNSKTSYTFRVRSYKMSGKTALYGATKTITVKTK